MLLTALSSRLASLDYDVSDQDVEIPVTRIPPRPASGLVIAEVWVADR